jgi:hypothetical protein
MVKMPGFVVGTSSSDVRTSIRVRPTAGNWASSVTKLRIPDHREHADRTIVNTRIGPS